MRLQAGASGSAAHAEGKTGGERRRSPRWNTRLPAQIDIAEHRVQLGCRVLDMSASGARVQLEQCCGKVRTADDLPERVVLRLTAERVDVVAAIRWRCGYTFGLEFASAFAR